jgi:predicted MFS family arabinose efflux permease
MSIWMMCLGRLVSGCAIGLLSTTVALYQSEVAPAQMRGGLTSL